MEKRGDDQQDKREAGSSAVRARKLLQRMCSATGHPCRPPIMFLGSVLRRKTRGCEIPSCSMGDPGSCCWREWEFMEQRGSGPPEVWGQLLGIQLTAVGELLYQTRRNLTHLSSQNHSHRWEVPRKAHSPCCCSQQSRQISMWPRLPHTLEWRNQFGIHSCYCRGNMGPEMRLELSCKTKREWN